MNKQEQKIILAELCDRLRDDLLEHIRKHRVPESWDGIELRQWVSDSASRYTLIMSRERKSDYDSVRLEKNI